MSEKLKDILGNLSTEVDQETLLLYLQGKLTAEQQHEVERKALQSDFDSDAWEGLQSLKDSHRVQLVVDQLNRDLRKKTGKKKAFREKLRLRSEPSLWMAIIIFLLLIVLSYFIIRQLSL